MSSGYQRSGRRASMTAPTSQRYHRPQTETLTAWRTTSGSARTSHSNRFLMAGTSFIRTSGSQTIAPRAAPGQPCPWAQTYGRRPTAVLGRERLLVCTSLRVKCTAFLTKRMLDRNVHTSDV